MQRQATHLLTIRLTHGGVRINHHITERRMALSALKKADNIMKEQHPVSDFTESALGNLRSLVDVNAIIGDPITTADGTVIIPVSKVSFGYGSGGSDLPTAKPDTFGGATAGGVTIQPLAFLVIQGEHIQLLQMQTAHSTADRVVNQVPSMLDKVLDMLGKKDKKEAAVTPVDEPSAQ